VAINPSSAAQIEALVADLAGDDAVRREAAVARLIVIGARAVDRLVALVASEAPASARLAALRVLEAIREPRGLDAPLAASNDRDPAIVLQAIATTRAFVRGSRGAKAVDHLTRVALDTSRAVRVRTEAITALGDLEPATLQPLWAALVRDPRAALRAHVHALAKRGAAATPAARDPADELNAARRRLRARVQGHPQPPRLVARASRRPVSGDRRAGDDDAEARGDEEDREAVALLVSTPSRTTLPPARGCRTARSGPWVPPRSSACCESSPACRF
jgi:hypothetical protein